MEKDKIVLSDGTEQELEYASGIAALQVIVQSKSAAAVLWEKFSMENLKNVQIKNAAGETTGRYQNLILDHITGRETADDTVSVIFCLRQKTMEEELREEIAALKAGQKTQDAAIGDLGQAVSDIAEGGM